MLLRIPNLIFGNGWRRSFGAWGRTLCERSLGGLTLSGRLLGGETLGGRLLGGETFDDRILQTAQFGEFCEGFVGMGRLHLRGCRQKGLLHVRGWEDRLSERCLYDRRRWRLRRVLLLVWIEGCRDTCDTGFFSCVHARRIGDSGGKLFRQELKDRGMIQGRIAYGTGFYKGRDHQGGDPWACCFKRERFGACCLIWDRGWLYMVVKSAVFIRIEYHQGICPAFRIRYKGLINLPQECFSPAHRQRCVIIIWLRSIKMRRILVTRFDNDDTRITRSRRFCPIGLEFKIAGEFWAKDIGP